MTTAQILAEFNDIVSILENASNPRLIESANKLSEAFERYANAIEKE